MVGLRGTGILLHLLSKNALPFQLYAIGEGKVHDSCFPLAKIRSRDGRLRSGNAHGAGRLRLEIRQRAGAREMGALATGGAPAEALAAGGVFLYPHYMAVTFGPAGS